VANRQSTIVNLKSLHMRLALIGYGKMGHAIETLAVERGHVIHAVIAGADNRNGHALGIERLAGVEVALEFTRPDAAAGNIEQLVRAGIPVVTGTTGWLDRFPEIEQLVRQHGGSLLHSPNFSVGVQLFLRAAGDLARRFANRPGFEASIVEQHHAGKLDAPSGTAVRLREVTRSRDPSREFPISSVRAGAIPGIHTLAYDSSVESVRLEHTAHGREAFAAGALAAAEWLPGHRGVFTFEEMLFGRDG